MFELTFHPGGRGLEIASSVVLSSAGSTEMIKRISASSSVNVICGASEASDTREMVSGANTCRRPSGTFSTPAATSTAGSTHGPSAVSTISMSPFGSSLTTRAQIERSCAKAGVAGGGDEQRRGDNRA